MKPLGAAVRSVAEQRHPWRLAPVERLVVRDHTPIMVSQVFGSNAFSAAAAARRSAERSPLMATIILPPPAFCAILAHWTLPTHLLPCFLDHADGLAVLVLRCNAGAKDWPERGGDPHLYALKAELVTRACHAAGRQRSWGAPHGYARAARWSSLTRLNVWWRNRTHTYRFGAERTPSACRSFSLRPVCRSMASRCSSHSISGQVIGCQTFPTGQPPRAAAGAASKPTPQDRKTGNQKCHRARCANAQIPANSGIRVPSASTSRTAEGLRLGAQYWIEGV